MVRLYAHGGSGNHGCEAIVRTTVKMLESQAVLATTAPEEDRRYGVEEAVTLLPDTPRIRIFSSRSIRAISVSPSAGTITVMAARTSSASTGGNSNGGVRKRSCGAAR